MFFYFFRPHQGIEPRFILTPNDWILRMISSTFSGNPSSQTEVFGASIGNRTQLPNHHTIIKGQGFYRPPCGNTGNYTF
jgi:hypothetical protein